MRRQVDEWARERAWASTICAAYGCAVERSAAAYEIAKVHGDGVSLVIYEHKTKGTGNISARVRDNGSKDRPKAGRVMMAMARGEGLPAADQRLVGLSNTFNHKHLNYLTGPYWTP